VLEAADAEQQVDGEALLRPGLGDALQTQHAGAGKVAGGLAEREGQRPGRIEPDAAPEGDDGIVLEHADAHAGSQPALDVTVQDGGAGVAAGAGCGESRPQLPPVYPAIGLGAADPVPVGMTVL